jgi:alpha-maltose-1-phosphate synthase
MQVTQSVCGVFWQFDLAREMEARGLLKRIYSTFPWQRLKRESVPRERVSSFPWIHTPWLAANKYLPRKLVRDLALLNYQTFDAWVAARIEECDALVSLSGVGLKTGQVVQRRGGKYVCDRGSSHMRYQNAILNEEYARWGFKIEACDPRAIDREEAEYAQADAIFVPSEFARRSFIEMGVPADKVKTVPYGVRLDRFQRNGEPSKESFDVMFAGTVSLRKGIPYLLEAFRKLQHPHKRLRLAGPVERETQLLLERENLDGVEVLGRMPQARLAEYMSISHALVLPSVEDGFGLVMAQAMACGTVVVSSENTGGPDLYENGVEGFIVPIRRADAIADRLQELAEDRALHQRMSEAALRRVKHLGGWHDYGEKCANHLRQLTQSRTS